MNNHHFYTSALLLLLPLVSFPMGMGEIKVKSHLDQPFSAEIPLLDAGAIPLAGIKANLASLEDFERIGLDRNEILSSLKFEVKKNSNDQYVINISSLNRITEPYLQILIDLAWANGQLYRSYTILLDPPGYQLGALSTSYNAKSTHYPSDDFLSGDVANKSDNIETVIHTHVVNHHPNSTKYLRNETIYSSTQANENIWQIAQRYSTPDTSLQQTILAIVGTNSQAFTQGNLNGLKIGERLRIPSNEEVLKIPADLARQEVEAHDFAWKSKQEIKHVLLPPYIDGLTGTSQFNKTNNITGTNNNLTINQLDSKGLTQTIKPDNILASNTNSPLVSVLAAVPSVPTSAPTVLLPDQSLPLEHKVIIPTPYLPQILQGNFLKIGKDTSASIVEPLGCDNTLLAMQVQHLQTDNSQLQKTIVQQNETIKTLKAQIQLINNGHALKTQVAHLDINQQNPNKNYTLLIKYYLLTILAGFGIAGYLASIRRRKKRHIVMPEKPLVNIPPIIGQDITTLSSDNSLTERSNDIALPNDICPDKSDKTKSEANNIDISIKKQNNKAEEHILDFEPGLDKLISADKEADMISDKSQGINDVLNDDKKNKEKDHELIKSKVALDTLLALAKTYISMEDLESAKQSLQEILDFGDANQKQEAKQLLDKVNMKLNQR